MINKEIIKNNFSRYARYYDRYSAVQNLCALELINRIKREDFDNILDIGCGTGNYTRLLRHKFPLARIKAIDISQEMIEVAKRKLQNARIEFMVADAEAIDLGECFDFISANASLQWFDNLKKALSRYKRFLNKNGVILFSIFGPRTFYELNKSLNVFGKNTLVTSSNFSKIEKIRKILKSLFKKVVVEQRIYKERYNSLSELLKKIKYSGIRGNSINRGIWTPQTIYNLEKIYKNNYKDIVVTYEVFFCKGLI